MRSIGLDVSSYDEQEKFESVTKIFYDKGESLISRAPDKKVDYIQGFLIVVKGNNLFYVNVEDHGVETLENSSEKIVQVQIQESALKLIELNEQY